MGIFQRLGNLLRLSQIEDASKISNFLHTVDIGSSGIENYSGYSYEEYLATLRGTDAADIWDKMRRGDPKVKMVLSAVKNPIKSAHWTINSAEGNDEYKKHAELIEQILFKDLPQSWTQQLGEILTLIEFGYSMFEVTHKVVLNHSKFGSYNSIEKLGWRSPRTIERWNLDPFGKLLSVSQYAYGDLRRLVDIPAEFLLIFTNEKEGDNYEGISALRPCYGPWSRKNLYLKYMAVGIEKYALPTPVMEVPEGKENSTQFNNAKTVLEKYVGHENQYILKPAGWKLEFPQTNFDAQKIKEAIIQENSEIASAFLENFLELGQSGSGSYALSNDLSDFFLAGIEHIAFNVCETFNRKLIPNLIKLNFGPQDSYPELTVSGIKDKAGRELAEISKLLVEARILTPDKDLEKNFREKYGLPKQLETQTQGTPQIGMSEKEVNLVKLVKLVEKPKTPRSLIAIKTEDLKSIMREMLGDTGNLLIQDLMAKKKRANPSQYLDLTSKVQPRGSRDYKEQLRQNLAEISVMALEQAKKEIPGGRKIRLTEKISHLALAENFYKNLPPSIQKMIDAQVGLLTTFQIQDLLKAVYFQFNNSVTSTDSDTLLEADLNETLDKFLEGASVAAAAGNSVAKAVNESRSTFFFEPDVLDEIESFTFMNGDPVSPICQDLNGTTFSKDDPNMDRYSPPLHHNCKSYLVPNLKGTTKELSPTGLQPSDPSLEKYITLADISSGQFVLAYIEVSKNVAMSQADARRIASEITSIPPEHITEESDKSYRFGITNVAIIEEGTLKSFEPMQGVHVYYGRSKKDKLH